MKNSIDKQIVINRCIRAFAGALAALLTLLLLLSKAHAGVLSPFNASYTVERGSLHLGTANFSLASWGNRQNCHVYHGVARPRTLIRFIVGDIIDETRFCTTENGQMRTQRFEHIEQKDMEDSHVLAFDWSQNRVVYTGEKARNGRQTLALPANAVDPFGLHVAARLWAAGLDDLSRPAQRTFTLVDEEEIKRYRLALSPGERLSTPLGDFDTVKLQRIDDPKKTLIFWAAPALDFMPIRVEHRKGDDPVIRMDIVSLQRGR